MTIPVSRLYYFPTPLELVVDDDISVRKIAEALAAHGMMIVQHKDRKRGRVMLTPIALDEKQKASEAARQSMLARGMDR